MLTTKIPNLHTLFKNPKFSSLHAFPIPPKLFSLSLSKTLKITSFEKPTIMSSSKTKITVEYAKSNRSKCKKCSKTIPSECLRLGLVTRDERGFDMTKWHHLECFKNWPESLSSVDRINGFTLLKGNDQDALREVLEKCATAEEEVLVGGKSIGEDNEPKSSTRSQVEKEDEDEKDKGKRAKTMPNEKASVEIVFSVSAIKDMYEDATLLPKWKAFQTVIFLEKDDGLRDSSKIAAFDFDGCLVKTSVKRVGSDAWSLMYSSIPDKLQSLYSDGYKLVIFTNEANITLWKKKRQMAVDSKIGRLNNFLNRVNVPMQVFIACGSSKGDDPFRKPKTGMWQILEQHFNSGIVIDMDQSFYVGDAAGRANDHSDADIKFAKAIGLKFYVPEEYFDT